MSNEIKLCPITQRMELMFKHQEKLMEVYKERGRIPSWTDKSVKENQEFIKGLIGSFIEESIEAFTKYEEAYLYFHHDAGSEPLKMLDKLKVLIKDFNEELADCTHFFIEILIYLGIYPEDLKAYYEKLGKEKGLPHITGSDPLRDAIEYATYVNVAVTYINNLGTTGNMYKIIRDTEGDPSLQAGRSMSTSMYENQAKLLFKCTVYLKRASNAMKAKHWRESREIDIDSVHNNIMEAWLYFFCYLSLVDCTGLSLYVNYLKKNKQNLERIKNGW